MSIALRPLARADLASIVLVQNASGPRMTLAALEARLFAPDRDHGVRVRVAERDGRVVGVAAWVGDPRQFFGAPVYAADG